MTLLCNIKVDLDRLGHFRTINIPQARVPLRSILHCLTIHNAVDLTLAY